MKKLIFGGVFFAFLGITLFACNKEELSDNTVLESDKSVESDNVVNEKARPGITILRCVPHRNKFKCEQRWGLCDCVWFPDVPRGTAGEGDPNAIGQIAKATVQTVINEANSTMIVSSGKFRKETTDTLFVDEDILLPEKFVEEKGFNHITIKKGAYMRDQNDNSAVMVDIEID